ncbi:MAG: hypothetical protein PHU06_07100 [Gallionella sp.]|nr:hypothetical protein [Gallionella sp.]
MEALNYCTHAIESLQLSVPRFLPHMPKTSQNILRVIELLKQAVKFRLPDNGGLFEDGLRALPAVFRLPYPIIAAEFSITNEGLGDGSLAMRGEELDRSTKRIALAIEINEVNFHSYSWLLPIPEELHELLTSDGAIAIIPVFYRDSKKEWDIPPLGLVIPARKVVANNNALNMTQEIYEGKFPKGSKMHPLEAYPIDLMPEYADQLEQEEGLNYVMATAQQDSHDEMKAIMGLVEILSCSNVCTETIPASHALNKKRTSKGKPPLFEFKVLTLDFQDNKTNASEKGGTHSSPRIHLRRGHIRRLPTKSIWVNATVVGNRQLGMVSKEYAVNPHKTSL